MLKKIMTLFASMAMLAGCGDVATDTMEEWNPGSGDSPRQDELLGSTEEPLNNGTPTTSLFPEVMRILTYYPSTGNYYTCTATAISAAPAAAAAADRAAAGTGTFASGVLVGLDIVDEAHRLTVFKRLDGAEDRRVAETLADAAGIEDAGYFSRGHEKARLPAGFRAE